MAGTSKAALAAAVSEWDGPIYGRRGVLEDDGARVECHCCGGWFKTMGGHLRMHGLTADAYRALFGLRQSTALASTVYRESMRRVQAGHLSRVRPETSNFSTWTPEQRSKRVRGRRDRLESQLHKQEVHAAQRRPRVAKPCACGCGQEFVARKSNKRRYLPGHRSTVMGRALAWIAQQPAPCGAAELATALGLSMKYAGATLGYLTAHGRLERVAPGQFRAR